MKCALTLMFALVLIGCSPTSSVLYLGSTPDNPVPFDESAVLHPNETKYLVWQGIQTEGKATADYQPFLNAELGTAGRLMRSVNAPQSRTQDVAVKIGELAVQVGAERYTQWRGKVQIVRSQLVSTREAGAPDGGIRHRLRVLFRIDSGPTLPEPYLYFAFRLTDTAGVFTITEVPSVRSSSKAP